MRTLCYAWLINCVVNMTTVFGQWSSDVHLCFCFVRKHLFTTTFMHIFISCNLLQLCGNNGACWGPSIRVLGSHRPKPDVALKSLIMFVLFTKCSFEQIFYFLDLFLHFPPSDLYAWSFVMTYAANGGHLVLSYKRLSETCWLGSMTGDPGLAWVQPCWVTNRWHFFRYIEKQWLCQYMENSVTQTVAYSPSLALLGFSPKKDGNHWLSCL